MSVLAVLFVMQAVWYIRYAAAPMRLLRARRGQEPVAADEPTQPGVSVIVSARNEGDNIEHYLQALLMQDYPAYEVIVVDDGSEDNTHDVIERYMSQSPRLHTTFVPRNARVGSTKKLALTLAAKSAQYDYLLLTDADCVPEGRQWISAMMAGFRQEGADIVLGYGAYFYEKGAVNGLVRYDTLFNGLHYMGAALCGHPYMGVGRNLAYRKSLFFSSGGFSHLMTYPAGDDDLFVNQVATRHNTSVVLGDASYTWSPSKRTMREWWQQKRRHLSVSPRYKRETQWRLLYEPLTRGLWYAAVVAAVVTAIVNGQWCLTNGVLWVTAGLYTARWLIQAVIINVSAWRMKQHGFGPLAILGMDIFLPLSNLWMLVVPKRRKQW